MNGVGAHEVVIESPASRRGHRAPRPGASGRGARAPIASGSVDLAKDPRLEYVMVFKNHGDPAGRLARAHPLAAHRHAHRAEHGGGGARGRASSTSGSRSAASGATSSARSARDGLRIILEAGRLRGDRPLRAALSVRDLDPARRRTGRASRTRRSERSLAAGQPPGRRSCGRMARYLGDPPYNFMLHSAPLRTPGPRPLPLAPRDHSQADEGGGVRVGNGFLHQPDPARGGGGIPPG